MRATSLGRGNCASLAAALFAFGLLCLLFSAIAAPAARAQVAPTVLSGYVLNYKGEFVAGATVALYTMPAHTVAGRTTTSDAQGRWTLDTGTGTFAIRSTAPGYDFAEQTVYATSYQTGITFILRQTGATEPLPLVATISGRVLSQDNVPLGGMVIEATNARDTGVRQVAPPPALNVTTTNADGTYSLAVPAGQIWMTLKTGAIWGYQRDPVTINPNQAITGADFVAAIRVLPRTDFPTPTLAPIPTATATPIAAVAPIVGMPSTGGGPANGLWIALAGAGLLALLAGSVLAVARTRRA